MNDGKVVRGVVLAGGDATRFDGGDKALADVDGRPMLARVVDAVDVATDGPPVLAVGDEAEGTRLRGALGGEFDAERSPSVDMVVDDPARSGPLAGIFAAVDAADADWLFVCACDMPLVTPSSIDAIRGAALRTGGAEDSGPDAVVPVVDGHRQPLHALYRRAAFAAVREDLPETASLLALLDALDETLEIPARELDAPLERATTNVNTRSDLADLGDAVDE